MADSTLHQRLLAELDRLDHYRVTKLGKIAWVVVELHAPVPYDERHKDPWFVCHGCDADGYDWERPEWPCSTIQAIADQLGLTDQGDSRG